MLTAAFLTPRATSSATPAKQKHTKPKQKNRRRTLSTRPSSASVVVPHAPTAVVQSPPQRLGDLRILKTLAPALFGEVLLCLDAATGRHVAVKRVDLCCARAHVTVTTRVQVVESLAQERCVHHRLAAVPTTNLLVLQEEVQCNNNLYLVFPFCSGGDLFHVVRHSPLDGRLPEATARRFLGDVVQGLLCLKQNGLAHRDISLENVVLDATGVCFVCDFGLATAHETRVAPGRVGKAWYMAPEVFAATASYSALPADIWSLGVLLAIMLTGAPLVDRPTLSDRHFCVLSQGGGVRKLHRVFPRKLSDGAWDVLEQMLHVDPLHRPTLEQVAAHPFLSSR